MTRFHTEARPKTCVEWIAAYRVHALIYGPFCADIAFELDPTHTLEFLVREW